MEIDLDKVFDKAVLHMMDETDVCWTIGAALQDLYWDKGIADLQKRMTEYFLNNQERK